MTDTSLLPMESYREYLRCWPVSSSIRVCGRSSTRPTWSRRRCCSAPRRRSVPRQDRGRANRLAPEDPGRSLARALRDLGRDKRNVDREQSLERALEQSSRRLEQWLAADQSPPSERAEATRSWPAWPTPWPPCPTTSARRWSSTTCTVGPWPRSRAARRSPKAVSSLLHRGIITLRAAPAGGVTDAAPDR